MTSHSNRPNGPAIRRYTELIVWQKAMTLVEVVYQASAQLPDRERFGITQQIRCAAVSVPCNIAEGHGRMNNGDYARFLAIARGSLLETETLLQLAVNLAYLRPRQIAGTMSLADEVSRILAVLIRKLGRRSPKR